MICNNGRVLALHHSLRRFVDQRRAEDKNLALLLHVLGFHRGRLLLADDVAGKGLHRRSVAAGGPVHVGGGARWTPRSPGSPRSSWAPGGSAEGAARPASRGAHGWGQGALRHGPSSTRRGRGRGPTGAGATRWAAGWATGRAAVRTSSPARQAWAHAFTQIYINTTQLIPQANDHSRAQRLIPPRTCTKIMTIIGVFSLHFNRRRVIL